MSVSESKAIANKNWDNKNRERKRYINSKSSARGFIKNRATQSDIKELKKLILDRENYLEKFEK